MGDDWRVRISPFSPFTGRWSIFFSRLRVGVRILSLGGAPGSYRMYPRLCLFVCLSATAFDDVQRHMADPLLPTYTPCLWPLPICFASFAPSPPTLAYTRTLSPIPPSLRLSTHPRSQIVTRLCMGLCCMWCFARFLQELQTSAVPVGQAFFLTSFLRGFLWITSWPTVQNRFFASYSIRRFSRWPQFK